MPTTIHVNVFVSPGVSRRLTFNESPVKFGREADNQIVITEKTASRYHGELRFENDRWFLVNLSANGTVVDRKSVGKKPHPLKENETVRIGDRPVFEVTFAQSVDKANATDEELDKAEDQETAKALARNKKLWTYSLLFVVYMTVIVGGGYYALNNWHPAAAVNSAPVLTDEEIQAEIFSPKSKIQPDTRDAEAQLQHAGELYNTLDASPSHKLYLAYDAYRNALALSNAKQFDQGIDGMRFNTVQERLTKIVQEKYRNGVAQLHSGRYKEAEATFHDLIREYYPDSTSRIFKNCELQRGVAVDQIKQRAN